jgi:hypothetical protein
MPPVDVKVRVGRKNHRVSKAFAHARKIRIREAHRHVGIFLQELEHEPHHWRLASLSDLIRSIFLQDRFGVDGDLNHVADDDPSPV